VPVYAVLKIFFALTPFGVKYSQHWHALRQTQEPPRHPTPALRQTQEPPRQVSELQVLDDFMQDVERYCYRHGYHLSMEMCNSYFLDWYAGGSLEDYYNRCKITTWERQQQEKNKILKSFIEHQNPASQLFEEFKNFDEKVSRTENKLKIMNIFCEVSGKYFDSLRKPGYERYQQLKAKGASKKALKNIRICAEFDYFVLHLLMSISKDFRTKYHIAQHKGNKGHVNNMTASGNQLTAPLSTNFWPSEALKKIFYQLGTYCKDVQDGIYENDRDYKGRHGNPRFQEILRNDKSTSVPLRGFHHIFASRTSCLTFLRLPPSCGLYNGFKPLT